MARGDQLYVMRPFGGLDSLYEHHGIDCGDGSVIHYYKGDGEPVIARTSYETFARGNPVYTKPAPVSFIPDVVIDRAESRLGERQYNLLSNNCEHFANWCKTGQNTSRQLANYGLDVSLIDPKDSRRLIEAAEQDGNPVQAMAQVQQALGNLAVVQQDLQRRYAQTEAEMHQWDRVAKAALQRDREDLARAALTKKQPLKKQLASLRDQINQAVDLQASLDRNSQALRSQVTIG